MATSRATSAKTKRPAPERLPDIFYEDPEPVEDGMLQWGPLNDISHLLKRYLDGRPGMFMSGGGYVMYNRDNGYDRVAPEFYIAFDVDVDFIRAHLPNFWIWEIGKAPDFVLEMATPSTAEYDLGAKRDLYARLGIAEYWRLDYTGGDLYGDPLVGERLVDGEYAAYPRRERDDGAVTAHSELLDLDICWLGDGAFDVLDPATGQTIDAVTRIRAARLAIEAALAAEAAAQAAEANARTLRAKADTLALQAELERMREERALTRGSVAPWQWRGGAAYPYKN